jgi:hypothetical protein
MSEGPKKKPQVSDRAALVLKEVDGLFDELDDLLKNEDVQVALGELKVNSSIALLAADGLRAYLKGDKETAMEDLSTAAEEIAQRFAQSAKGDA